MSQLTISQAEMALANMAGLSDNQRSQFQAEVNKAKANATRIAEQAADSLAAEVRAERDDLLREACEVRDQLAALAKTPGADGTAAFSELRQRHRKVVAAIERIEERANAVEQIEADPVAYADSLHARFPGTRPHFTF
jgi:hypothetical protein